MPDIPIRRRPPDEVRERLAASGLPGDFIDALTGEEETEREQLVADAIILERAGRVLERRFRAELLMDPAVHATGEVLRRTAAHLRLEAGHA
jgi:hypothetical protein